MVHTEHNGDLGHVYLKHKPKSVALVCMGPSATDYLTATLTQEYKIDWVDEVWCINMAANPFRCDVVFWMDDLVEQEKFRPELFRALRHWGVPVITSTRRPEVVPNSYDYPISEVARMSIPVFGKPYLNNGVAMAIGYAMHIGVQNMAIYGADFSYPGRDYAESGRACVECWVTFAGIRGMNIALPPNTSLMDSVKDQGIYGYHEQPSIHLPNGQVFRYVRQKELGKYIPEDSSGAKNGQQVQSERPAAGSDASAIAPGNGRRIDDPNKAPRAALAPAPGPGESLRDCFADGGYKESNLALHDSGGAVGGVPQPAEAHVPLPSRTDEPRLPDGRV